MLIIIFYMLPHYLAVRGSDDKSEQAKLIICNKLIIIIIIIIITIIKIILLTRQPALTPVNQSSGRTGLGSQPEPGPDVGFSVRTETDGRELTTTPKLTPTLDS
jgi:hypothetical protein